MLLVSNCTSMVVTSMSKVALAQAKRLALLMPWPCTPERLRMCMAGLQEIYCSSLQEGLSPPKITDLLELPLWQQGCL